MHTLQLLCNHLVPLQDSKNSSLLCACAIFRSCNLKGEKKRQQGGNKCCFTRILCRCTVCERTHCSVFVLRCFTLHRQHHIQINSFELAGFNLCLPYLLLYTLSGSKAFCFVKCYKNKIIIITLQV